MSFKAVVLDFDGLIVDTETPILAEWQAVFRRHGHELTLDEWQRGLGTHRGYDPCAHLFELTGQAFDHEALRQEVRARNLERCAEQPLLPGVTELLRDACLLGLGTAVASSSTSAWVERWLAHHGIRGLVDAVCARDHVERVKPAPDLFLLAAARLGAEPQGCVVFEDSPNGVRAARSAGMRCVAVPNGVTMALALPGPDLVLSSLAEMSLSEILGRLERVPAPKPDGPQA